MNGETTTKGRHKMTLDEYMADQDDYKAWHAGIHEMAELLDEAIGRLAVMQAERDCWEGLAQTARQRCDMLARDRDQWQDRCMAYKRA
jgi:hypothetical protein